jgi:DNA-binding NarL/FixJ family response regulator
VLSSDGCHLPEVTVPKTILIVDDHPLIRDATRRFFERQNFEVCGEAVDGIDAVEKASQLKPDLIIMDFVMPRMNGLQAARKLRTLEIHVPIILLTMYTEAVHGMPSFSVVNAVVAKTDAEEVAHQACILLAL